jgi:hypothetical protein
VALKAAAQEKAQARKDKQAMAKAKEAERERRRNQENIHCECHFSSISLSYCKINYFLALNTRQRSEDGFCQPAPQDATVSFNHAYFLCMCSLLLSCSSVYAVYLQESMRLLSISLPAPAGSLLCISVRPSYLLHVTATRQR